MLKGGIREWKEKGFAVVVSDADGEAKGPRLYKQHCAACHGDAGQGMANHFPPLENDPMMKSKDAWPAIWVTLEGLGGRPLAGRTYMGSMGPFKKILTDDEIAALLTYARREFGGVKTPVLPSHVLDVRRDIAGAQWKPKGMQTPKP